MSKFLGASEEENLELIGSWWEKYKILIVVGILLISSIILGREVWIDSSQKSHKEVTELYSSFLTALEERPNEASPLAEELIVNFPDSLYADLVSFHLVKFDVSRDKLDDAAGRLRKIIVKNSSSFSNTFSPIQNIAKTRLARILLSQGKPAQALELILESKDLTSELYEIKGDAETALERPTDARISYLQSLDLSQNEVIRNLIRMKIADLQFNVED